MTKTMRFVLEKLVIGEACYVTPSTRRALKRYGFITYADTSLRSDRIVVTDVGRAALEGQKP